MTKNILLENISQPEVLEEAYHNSLQEFEAQLKEDNDSETLRVWNARLAYFPTTSSRNFPSFANV